MKVIKWLFTILVFAVFLVSHVQAQELIVYPAQGQSSEQMEKDKFECYSWAKAQANFDPMQMPTATSTEETGQVVLTASGEQVAFVVFGAALPF